MSFSITNNSANAVVTAISTPSSTYGEFTITSGSFPLLSGDTISGTNTAINNLKGSPYGTIQIFLQQGDAQIEMYINGTLYSALDYSSGIAEVQVPILSAGDTIAINIDEADLPVPSVTPSNTPAVTPTPTPSTTPAATPTPTPSSTPTFIDPASLGAIFWNRFSNESFLNLSGTDIIDVIDGVSGTTYFKSVSGSPANDTIFSGGSFVNACEPTYSGASYSEGGLSRITSLNGDYGNSTADYTLFVRFLWDGNTAYEGFFFTSDIAQPLYDGTNLTNRWFQHKISTSGKIELNIWADPAAATGYVSIDQGNINATANTWTNLVVRAYNDGADYRGDVFIDGSFIRQNAAIGVSGVIQTPAPGILLNYGSENIWTAESGMFNRKLTNTEVADVFTYLNAKYC